MLSHEQLRGEASSSLEQLIFGFPQKTTMPFKEEQAKLKGDFLKHYRDRVAGGKKHARLSSLLTSQSGRCKIMKLRMLFVLDSPLF